MHSEDTPCCTMITHIIDQLILDTKSKQSQSYKFKEFAKTSIYLILKKQTKKPLHSTNLLKLLYKMCKY